MIFPINIRKKGNLHYNDKQVKYPTNTYKFLMTSKSEVEGRGTYFMQDSLNINTEYYILILLIHNDVISLLLVNCLALFVSYLHLNLHYYL